MNAPGAATARGRTHQQMLDVAVIGGGPGGLHAATLLARAGFAVTLFEEHDEVGQPVHCTGVLADDAFGEFDLPRASILNTLSTATIHLARRIRDFLYDPVGRGARRRSPAARSDDRRASDGSGRAAACRPACAATWSRRPRHAHRNRRRRCGRTRAPSCWRAARTTACSGASASACRRCRSTRRSSKLPAPRGGDVEVYFGERHRAGRLRVDGPGHAAGRPVRARRA